MVELLLSCGRVDPNEGSDSLAMILHFFQTGTAPKTAAVDFKRYSCFTFFKWLNVSISIYESIDIDGFSRGARPWGQ